MTIAEIAVWVIKIWVTGMPVATVVIIFCFGWRQEEMGGDAGFVAVLVGLWPVTLICAILYLVWRLGKWCGGTK